VLKDDCSYCRPDHGSQLQNDGTAAFHKRGTRSRLVSLDTAALTRLFTARIGRRSGAGLPDCVSRWSACSPPAIRIMCITFPSWQRHIWFSC
jgi:hypothetical protein